MSAGKIGRRRIPHVHRAPSWLALGGLALTTVCLLMPSGAALAPKITHTAPYHHVAVANSNYRAGSGCYRSGGDRAHWNATSGIATFSTTAHAKKCPVSSGSVGSGSDAFSQSQSVLSIPVKSIVGTTGVTSIRVNWDLTANGSQAETIKGACPIVSVSSTTGNGNQYCDVDGEVYLTAAAYLVDLTNGTVFYESNPWYGNYSGAGSYNDTYCSAFVCTNYNGSYAYGANFSRTLSLSFWINGTLGLVDSYNVITYVVGYAYAVVDGYARSSASAQLNLSTHGNQADLVSVVVK